MGQAKEADGLYQKSIALVDGMIQHAATTNIQRQLLAEMSDVYSGYFESLCAQKRYDDALQALEQVRGRVETEALEHHASQPVHAPTPDEQELTRLNLALINTDDPATRASLIGEINNTELKISPSALAQETTVHPVHLSDVQRSLSPNALLIEYVLAERNSYAFAITRTSVTPYHLPAKTQIESDSNLYRKEIRAQKADLALAQRLFTELLNPIKEYHQKTDLVIVPDSSLHLLPFAALADKGSYVLKTHTVDVAPSSTVFDLLRKRLAQEASAAMPYIGVAAWTQPADTRNPIVRAISGPERSQLAPLPDSKLEVETIAADLPRPSTILLGADATETRFKHLSLNSTEVIHLALHGYADLDYPDRSALIFAPDPSGSEDGLLQVREIRSLHLKAKLVTLSACNTGVGPVGEAGVANLVNAFIEAGADSVVSTLWELEDHATEHLMATSLIFAPDSSGSEDGLLQVREIRSLHLKAKLVTLSACNTGVGPVGEAGVANLVNAFIEAGADSVVSTLWELEDHATEHLMAMFYSQLAQHTRKVDALRTAQLDFLNQGLPPYFWASFQIVGDPNGTL